MGLVKVDVPLRVAIVQGRGPQFGGRALIRAWAIRERWALNEESGVFPGAPRGGEGLGGAAAGTGVTGSTLNCCIAAGVLGHAVGGAMRNTHT